MEERGIVTYMAGAPPEGVSPNTIYYVVKQSDGQEVGFLRYFFFFSPKQRFEDIGSQWAT